MRRLLPALVLAAASVTAAGCNDFHYYDIDVTFNTAAGQFAGINEVSTIQVMRMLVSGADNADFQIGPNANGLPLTTGAHLGVFEFSTFADSGTLTFVAMAFDDATSNPACKTGQGMKSVNASPTTTNTVMLTVDKVAEGCVAITPP
jgi:hypothetical protein